MNLQLEKINELRNKLKPYKGRAPFDLLKEIDEECNKHKIDNWLVRCTDTQFNTAKTKGDLTAF